MLDELRTRGIRDEAILTAFAVIPREAFVPARVLKRFAYSPVPLPIGRGQTLSQPYIVARMLAAAEIDPEQTVLDVEAGSGYQTALLSRLCRRVHALEIIPQLARRASETLGELGITNASVHVADGNDGLVEHGPYDAILVAATAPALPQRLVDQLKPGARLVVPIGRRMSKLSMAVHMLRRRPSPQQLYRVVRTEDVLQQEPLEPVYFVPFVGG